MKFLKDRAAEMRAEQSERDSTELPRSGREASLANQFFEDAWNFAAGSGKNVDVTFHLNTFKLRDRQVDSQMIVKFSSPSGTETEYFLGANDDTLQPASEDKMLEDVIVWIRGAKKVYK